LILVAECHETITINEPVAKAIVWLASVSVSNKKVRIALILISHGIVFHDVPGWYSGDLDNLQLACACCRFIKG
jgi:hypothetical protein